MPDPTPIVYVVDDDNSVRESLKDVIRKAGWQPLLFGSAEAFLSHPRQLCPSCLVMEVLLPGLTGLDLQQQVASDRADMPIIFISAQSDVLMTVRAMKAGATEFLTKPLSEQVLLEAIRLSLDCSRSMQVVASEMKTLKQRYACLSNREREVMSLVVSGLRNKQVAHELRISEITVKAHRGRMMRKMQADSLAELVTIATRLHIPAAKRRHAMELPTGLFRFSARLFNLALFVSCAALAVQARASDHLDSPATVANPQADIADVYAWPSTDGKRLNLAMTIQAHTFSNKVDYVIHIDSGKIFGHTTASTSIGCRFAAANAIRCHLGNSDSVSGDPTNANGLEGEHRVLRVYAGLRDDPFYNNIKGLVAAYQAAGEAIKKGAAIDVSGCAHFDTGTAKAIREQMTHTDGGPAKNFLYNWTASAIVVSVDLRAVTTGGKMLAVWGSTSSAGRQIDRMARPFVVNTLLGVAPFSTDDASGVRREEYNALLPADSAKFVPDLQKSLAFQDSLDGECGNQLLAEPHESPARYAKLASVFADDRLWVNSASRVCTQFFAVEIASLSSQKVSSQDCGGRTPTYDTSNTWRSLLISGTLAGITDGLNRDEHSPSATEFPFLAPPAPERVDH
jgi:FixJ family two-component response regulator